LPGDAPVILGQGDPNLANFLWDGTDIRIVDFEDSGASSRAFELAILVEHVSAWSDSGLESDAFLTMFDLTKPELAMLLTYRRLAALFWLLKLQSRGEAEHRHGDDALNRQAERLLSLLG
jgi:Ser/Thr protein kinase RdoA (MazF antagonist)